jgi:hypothetical protein
MVSKWWHVRSWTEDAAHTGFGHPLAMQQPDLWRGTAAMCTSHACLPSINWAGWLCSQVCCTLPSPWSVWLGDKEASSQELDVSADVSLNQSRTWVNMNRFATVSSPDTTYTIFTCLRQKVIANPAVKWPREWVLQQVTWDNEHQENLSKKQIACLPG